MRRGVGLLAGVGVAFGALGWATGSAVSASPQDQAAATVSTSIPGEADAADGVARDRPLRVSLAGDSVMAGLAPAVTAALEGGGDAEVEFVLTPSILRDATIRYSWSQQLEEFDPDVVVMFVGTWELGEVSNQVGTSVGPNDLAWRTAYDDEVLDPWIELITSAGADVVWLGAPAVESAEVDVLFAVLNDAYRDLADRWDQVTYIESTEALAGTGSGFVPVATTPQGEEVRVRQLDGLHLCPDGAVLLAEAVVEELRATYRVPVGVGWQNGGWRDDDEFPADACPPP
jgi:hypothetical protein